jgi:hypothetical protein
MPRGGVRAYLELDWSGAASSRRAHGAAEFQRAGGAATLAASRILWRHVRAARPGWPAPEERRKDRAHHVALERAIDRAARVFTPSPAR